MIMSSLRHSPSIVLLGLIFCAGVLARPLPLWGDAARTSEEAILTQFERFVTEECSPCVKEATLVASVRPSPFKANTWSRAAGGRTLRQGEIGIEAVRSYVVGQPMRQMVAVRVSLAVATGGPAEMYRIATGMIDEDETAVLLSGLASIIRASTVLSSPQASGTVELDVRTTSVRIGVLRAGAESVAFVQAGDARQLGRRSIWETAATLYLPVSDLPALTTAITQAAAAADTMRSR